MFDLIKKDQELPSWLSAQPPIVTAIFKKASEIEKTILERIDNGESLKPSERKISYAGLSESFGKNKAYINSRDFPDLYDHIRKLNENLEQQATLVTTTNKSKGKTENQLDKMSRSELLEQCRERGNEITNLHRVIASNALSDIYERSLSSNRFASIGMMKTLQEDNEKLQEKNAKLVSQIHQLQKELISAIEKIEVLERKAKTSLKRVQ